MPVILIYIRFTNILFWIWKIWRKKRSLFSQRLLVKSQTLKVVHLRLAPYSHLIQSKWHKVLSNWQKFNVNGYSILGWELFMVKVSYRNNRLKCLSIESSPVLSIYFLNLRLTNFVKKPDLVQVMLKLLN